MKLITAVSAAVLLLATAPVALAESTCPVTTSEAQFDLLPEKCRAEMDTWAMSQPDTSIDIQGDIVVGTVVPETVQFVEVPVYKRYGYVVVNKKRILVDRDTRTVIRVY